MARDKQIFPPIQPISITLTPTKDEAHNIERLIKLFNLDSPKELANIGIELLVTIMKEFHDGYEPAFYKQATDHLKVFENYPPLEAARRNIAKNKAH